MVSQYWPSVEQGDLIYVYFRLQTNDTHSSDEVELEGGVNFKSEENPIPNNDANRSESTRVLLKRYVSFRFDVNSLQ